jgi:hypothetical protein
MAATAVRQARAVRFAFSLANIFSFAAVWAVRTIRPVSLFYVFPGCVLVVENRISEVTHG